MREFKFRVWQGNIMDYFGFADVCIGLLDPTGYGVWDAKIMQYTGLKDRNGKEIYESDIVKVFDSGIHFDPENYDIYKVHWSQFGWTPFVAKGCQWTSYFGEIKEFEVIGNIYENPELMEK